MFEIDEDTPEQEFDNLIQHSTCTLDISDDEGRPKNDRGKENIPPLDYVVPANARQSASRNDMMIDESRTPLGDLEASQYYAEGCDESSAFIIPDEKPCEDAPVASDANTNTTEIDTTKVTVPCQAPTNVNVLSEDGWKDLMAQFECYKKSSAALALAATAKEDPNEAEIEIWESESAKAEEETTLKETAPDTIQTIMPDTYVAGTFGDKNATGSPLG